MDYSFVRAKLRVVEYRDRLVKLAYLRAVAGSMNATQNEELMECLKNAGERKEPVIWTQRVGRSVPLIYYGGTAAVCACAIRVLVT